MKLRTSCIVKFALLGLYSLVFAELFLRIFSPQAILPRYVTGSDIGIRQNVANAVYWHYTPEIEVEMRINSAGIRSDREFPFEKPEGVCRIVILGDSFFMSYEVTLENSYGSRLEARLATLGHNCEVINLAVSGFGTTESLIQLQEVGLKYDPDFVVLEWHQTDPSDNLRSDLFAFENNQLVRKSAAFLPAIETRDKLMEYGVYRWLIQNCHLYTAIRYNLAIFVKRILLQIKSAATLDPAIAVNNDTNTDSSLLVQPRVMNLDSSLVNKVAEVAKTNNAKTLLLDIPWERFDGKIVSSFDQLTGTTSVDVLKLSPVADFEQLLTENVKLYYVKGHKHFTPAGYDVLARISAEKIAGLLVSDNNLPTEK